MVEVITDEELDLGAEEVSGKSYFELLRELFRAAQRQASGADDVIESILEELELDDEIPF